MPNESSLVWCCRKAGELELMGPRVLAMTHALGLQLTTKVYYTGEADGLGLSYQYCLKPSNR